MSHSRDGAYHVVNQHALRPLPNLLCVPVSGYCHQVTRTSQRCAAHFLFVNRSDGVNDVKPRDEHRDLLSRAIRWHDTRVH
jgi:hypothetical protein